ncbi:uncharacterized protein PHALS_09726 [Plasmopara halstedii]|uniref:Uncharacterized protein n=1 Tax=Plasmopara halstedii TaxID=4781 RepID=A0A0P1AFS1_PLAHL|nr:uncharacterized protein PHALS_09726 [Plasmopara halstedii]CEG39482.1 hypothetical protein PHALS_09726 [Plasmopara halstedii]|eukprot:XP_024575851.1 hypothetical protein PHALS_09726 [Plasmopara halstedii]
MPIAPECGIEEASVHVHGGTLCAVVGSGPPNERRQADGAMGGIFSGAKVSSVTSRDQLGVRAVKKEWELLVGWHGLEDAEVLEINGRYREGSSRDCEGIRGDV